MAGLQGLWQRVARLGERNGSAPDLPSRGWKAEVLRDFCRWLIALPEAEPPAPEGPTWDLQSLLSELVALRQEVRLGSREQAKMRRELETSASVQTRAADLFESHSAGLDERHASERREAERTCILPFLDLRDALLRGRAAAAKARASRSLFRRPAPGIEGVAAGYELVLERYDAALRQLGVSVVATTGQRFDPRTMVACETRVVDAAADGQVVEQIRSGFLRGDEVLRPADVVVGRGSATS